MNIDKSKLRIGVWYEDDEGNMYRNNESCEILNDKCREYHSNSPHAFIKWDECFGTYSIITSHTNVGDSSYIFAMSNMHA